MSLSQLNYLWKFMNKIGAKNLGEIGSCIQKIIDTNQITCLSYLSEKVGSNYHTIERYGKLFNFTLKFYKPPPFNFWGEKARELHFESAESLKKTIKYRLINGYHRFFFHKNWGISFKYLNQIISSDEVSKIRAKMDNNNFHNSLYKPENDIIFPIRKLSKKEIAEIYDFE